MTLVRRVLTPPPLKRERVRARAREQFIGKNLQATRERTGVLIYVSMREHMAELMADEGIAGSVEPQVWDQAMAALTAGLRRGAPAEGFAAAIGLCADVLAERFPARPGDNPDELPAKYARMINQALAVKPADMTITTHVCRGNFRSTWISEGGYEPVAEVLFGKVGYDGYFLEYDTERAGGFEPLRFVPKSKKVVLGLVSSKRPELESKDALKRRIDEATKYVPLDQLSLSPQCGFSSTVEGNVLNPHQEVDKLRLVLDVARDVWGDA